MFTAAQVPAHPFDLIRIGVRRITLHSCRQVQNNFAILIGLPNIHNRFTDFQGELGFGIYENFWRILQPENRGIIELLFCLRNYLAHPAYSQFHSSGFIVMEYYFPKSW